MERISYPMARRDSGIIDDYHGKKVADPYAWLEDPDANETKEFVEKQNEISLPYLEKCEFKEKFRKRLVGVLKLIVLSQMS
jgi:prolyl oligopeptidase